MRISSGLSGGCQAPTAARAPPSRRRARQARVASPRRRAARVLAARNLSAGRSASAVRSSPVRRSVDRREPLRGVLPDAELEAAVADPIAPAEPTRVLEDRVRDALERPRLAVVPDLALDLE